ncbi:MAG: hypothetical protein V3V14_13940 [Saprospiraceae bacterium]
MKIKKIRKRNIENTSRYDIVKIIENRVIQNIAIWVIFLLLLAIAITAENKLLAAFYVILLLMPPVYINSFFILPHFRTNKKIFFVAFFTNAISFSIFSTILVYFIWDNIRWEAALSILSFLILVLTFTSALLIARDSFVQHQEAKEAELKLL